MLKGIFSERFFRKIALLSVGSILLLVFVGGLVRITGSGMGCPDWPKCFGYYIPPTEIEQLTFSPGREFKKGQMIIKDERLWVAQHNFTTGQNFEAADWKVYTKHDYAKFNPTHTYIEWVNRMVSVMVGIFMVLTVISSFQYWKSRRSITVLTILSFFLTLFQAWLGAKVVESNLEGIKISIHMLAALAVVGLVMVAVFRNHTAPHLDRFQHLGSLKWLVMGVIALTLVQIYYGTIVRELVDHNEPEIVGSQWTQLVRSALDPHKSLSVFVMAAVLVLYALVSNRLEKSNPVYRWSMIGVVLAAVQIGLGALNVFFDLPPAVRVLHVTVAGLLVASQFYVAILLFNHKKEGQELKIN